MKLIKKLLFVLLIVCMETMFMSVLSFAEEASNSDPLLTYLITYRDAVVSGAWFWENPWGTLYFWAFTIIMLKLGTTLFTRLKPHFADVL